MHPPPQAMKNTPNLLILTLLLIAILSHAQTPKKTTPAVSYGNNAKNGHYFATRGINLYYETYGQGKPLLLIHGNGGSALSKITATKSPTLPNTTE